jgi:hypothetical protein
LQVLKKDSKINLKNPLLNLSNKIIHNLLLSNNPPSNNPLQLIKKNSNKKTIIALKNTLQLSKCKTNSSNYILRLFQKHIFKRKFHRTSQNMILLVPLLLNLNDSNKNALTSIHLIIHKKEGKNKGSIKRKRSSLIQTVKMNKLIEYLIERKRKKKMRHRWANKINKILNLTHQRKSVKLMKKYLNLMLSKSSSINKIPNKRLAPILLMDQIKEEAKI